VWLKSIKLALVKCVYLSSFSLFEITFVICQIPLKLKMGILEKVAEIEKEIARTQKNKGW
jgi:hypothetical protein